MDRGSGVLARAAGIAAALICVVVAAAAVLSSGGGRTVHERPVALREALTVSTATCSPSPCKPGSYVGHTITVDDGAGKLVQRSYGIVRPIGLTDAATNLAPLVVDINNGDWAPVGADNRFVVVVIPNDAHCDSSGGNCQYAAGITNPDPSTVGVRTCGPTGDQLCDDVPWIKAVLDTIVCAGAPPCENIDPSHVYASGSSKGATMVHNLMCDPSTSTRFDGFQSISSPMISPSTANDPGVLPTCPAVLGATPNRDFSAQWMLGDHDTSYSSCPGGVACLETGYTDAKNRWTFGMAQLAGDARFGQRVIGAALGCSATAAETQVSAHVIRRVYGSCAFGGRATSYVKVIGGGHGEPGIRGIDGFVPDAESWAFWMAHQGDGSGPAGTTGPGAGTPPGAGTVGGPAGATAAPAVTILRPLARQRLAIRSATTHARRRLLFSGGARSSTGVASVSLTLQRLGGHAGSCRWLDPRAGLVRRSCKHPPSLRAILGRSGHWRYAVPRRIHLPAGRYRVCATGRDRHGTVGNSAPARRRTVTFTLV